MSRRSLVILTVVSIVIISALLTRRIDFEKTDVEPQKTSSLSQEERTRIQDFWRFYRLGEQLKREGRWQQAIPEYRRALNVDSQHENSLYSLANCYLELNRFTEALEVLEQLVKAHPMSRRGYQQIGILRASPLAGELFDLLAAKRALLRAVEINKEESGSLLLLAEE